MFGSRRLAAKSGPSIKYNILGKCVAMGGNDKLLCAEKGAACGP